MSMIDILVPSDNQEGTKMIVQSWLKNPGDTIAKNEPVVEMETDKVIVEIEAPDSGVISEILAEAGQEVEPGALIGRISIAAESPQAAEKSADHDEQPANDELPPTNGSSASQSTHPMPLSPSVRRFIAQHGLNVDGLVGTGKRGRLTLCDVKSFKQQSGQSPKPAAQVAEAPNEEAPAFKPAQPKQIGDMANLHAKQVPHSPMRRSIANHMSHSVTVAPHVTAVFEADFTAIATHRAKHKAAFADQGVKLTYTAYFVSACVSAMKAAPEVNSQWHDDHLDVFTDMNIGIGTALGDQGLIVPVIQQAQEKNLLGIAKSLQDITDKARSNQLKPADMRGGTFTISNHGTSGSLVATPIIINQPQSAILGIGKLEKRAVVETIQGQDYIAIKPMAYVSLTIDHRVLDGYQTNLWLNTFVDTLQNWPSESDF